MKDTRLQDLLKRTRESLVKPGQLLKEAKNVPASVALAFTTQRPGLIRAAAPTALTTEQVSDLYDFIATLIETNHALQQHAHQVAQLVDMWMANMKGMSKAANKITLFADFKDMDYDPEEG